MMTLKNALTLLFAGVLVGMLVATTQASIQQSILAIPQVVQANPWFQATLGDAYAGFITFYVWVAYRSPHPVARVVWFVAIMLLGNIAMASYMLYRLWQWPKPYRASALLLRSPWPATLR
jgi:hypothetical protein